jgi:Glycosyltransferases, probably involved in cell wall biogenesis
MHCGVVVRQARHFSRSRDGQAVCRAYLGA